MSDLSSVECYSNQTDQWQLVSAMKTPRSMVGVTILNSHLFAVGGCNGQSLESVEVYNPETNVWTIHAPMKVPRSGVGMAVIDGLLFAIGGCNGMDYLHSVEVFHPQKKKMDIIYKYENKSPAIRLLLLINSGYINKIINHHFSKR